MMGGSRCSFTSGLTLVLLLINLNVRFISGTQNDAGDIVSDSSEGGSKSEDEDHDKNDKSQGRQANLTQATEASMITEDFLKIDEYSILNTKRNIDALQDDLPEDSCMVLNGSSGIPWEEWKGTKGFGEDCDPAARPGPDGNATNLCKRYEMIEFKTSLGNVHQCLRPTHFFCDEYTKKCNCAHEGNMVSPIRFQVGTQFNKNHKKGVCMIRPTFDIISTIDCSPSSVVSEVVLNEEEDNQICGCSDNNTDNFSTTDKDWWLCSPTDRSWIITGNVILIFSLSVYYLGPFLEKLLTQLLINLRV